MRNGDPIRFQRAGDDLRADRAAVVRAGFRVEVTLRVGPGQIVALTGPNGSGKTTMLHALAGLLPLDEGTVALGNQECDGDGAWVPPQHRKFALVPQSSLVFGHLTALQNVAFGAQSRGVRRDVAERDAMGWLERFHLADLAGVRGGHLSGGQAQCVAIVRALASEPRVLLLDEPFSALDATARPRVREIVAACVRELEIPAVLVSHDSAEVSRIADEVGVLAWCDETWVASTLN